MYVKEIVNLLVTCKIFSLMAFIALTVISCGNNGSIAGSNSIDSNIDSVRIIPPDMPDIIETVSYNIYMLHGETIALTAIVHGKDDFDKTVRWTLLGSHHSSKTAIDEYTGVITIAADEDHGMPLFIKATSTANTDKSDTVKIQLVRHLPSAFTGEWELTGSDGTVYVISTDYLKQFVYGIENYGSRHTVHNIWPRWNSVISGSDYHYGYALGSSREQSGMAVTNQVYFHNSDPARLLLVLYPGTAPRHFRELRRVLQIN